MEHPNFENNRRHNGVRYTQRQNGQSNNQDPIDPEISSIFYGIMAAVLDSDNMQQNQKSEFVVELLKGYMQTKK